MNQHHGLNEAEPLREDGREGEGRAPEGGREGGGKGRYSVWFERSVD